MKHSLYLSAAEFECGIVRNPKAHRQDSPSQNDPPIASFRQRDGKAMYVSCPDRNNERYVQSYTKVRLLSRSVPAHTGGYSLNKLLTLGGERSHTSRPLIHVLV